MSDNLKLYVWDTFETDHSEGLAFAIAETVQDAQQIIKKTGYKGDKWGNVKEYPLNKIGFHVYGSM